MPEDFLHYLFEQQLITNSEFEIISTGVRNHDAGPDFINAKIKIEDTIWAGNIEIHIKASDWFKHNHHLDKAYDNIILHLVLEDDKPISNTIGRHIPSYELKFDYKLYNKYLELINSQQWIHCEDYIQKVDSFTKNTYLDTLCIQRLERKSKDFKQLVEYNKFDWENAFFQAICKGFGSKVNQIPFELIAKQTDYKILLKHRNNLIQIEAILLGQAGLLSHDLSLDNDYIKELISEYQFLSHKYQLQSIRKELVKYSKIRPYNFPDIKLALLAQLLKEKESILSKVIDCISLEDLSALFSLQASDYWTTHYRLGTASKAMVKKMGKTSLQHIIINTVIPFLYEYANQTSRPELADRCLSWLEQIEAEQNTITRKWEDRGFENNNALQSQGLIELKNEKCAKHQCINCRIGHKILTLTWNG